ncbi:MULTISPECIES: cobalamin biosynthesis protein [Pseudomonas]|uniref:Cobalamin biosynthesis protein CbiG n=1 Tax=Pseudomonas putida TaxID=303 RepID=A0A1B2F4U4_PSEPU|nr:MULTISPECIES: cobalamin biosynthesis protein [Pseudomonas]ANY87288.1 cobalamin biosynthesis protein CbiG [Pseudomonas putida]MCL8305019.1 cobalamin biosynthesis protein [Pseudomonas putida]
MRDAPAEPVFYAGFGCRKGCPVDALEQLLRKTLATHGLSVDQLGGLASIDLKMDEPGLRTLADRLGVPLMMFSATHLHPFEPQLSHRSTVAYAHSGCWGVAESAALALAARAQGASRLLVTRQVLGQATLALALGR